jgi:hypothetical protein
MPSVPFVVALQTPTPGEAQRIAGQGPDLQPSATHLSLMFMSLVASCTWVEQPGQGSEGETVAWHWTIFSSGSQRLASISAA